MSLGFSLELLEEALLIELLEKAGVDEVFGLLGFCRGHALRDFVDGVAHALDVGVAAIVGYLHKALIGRVENFGVGRL